MAEKLVHYTVEISIIMGRVANHKIGKMVAIVPNCKGFFKEG